VSSLWKILLKKGFVLVLFQCTVICCKDCGLFIADKKDVFSMAKDGPLGMYVNPGGYIHEMITVYRAEGLKNVGGPSMENTWFEGSETFLYISAVTIC